MSKIDDTFAEAFDGIFTRVIVTAKDRKRMQKAAYGSTALPSVVIGRVEGGVERFLKQYETPDGRVGAILQFWGAYNQSHAKQSVDLFYRELSYRIRQGILVVPTTALYNSLETGEKLDLMSGVGHCGDGYESEEDYLGRRMIRIPLMMGDFLIERYIGRGFGIAGGNIWLFCKDEDAALKAGEKAIKAISKVHGVITPFDICSAGSKPETKFPEIGPTTNHYYCPSLRKKIADSKVPENVNSIPEIVINGISLDAVKKAMGAAIHAVKNMPEVIKISAGNYGGKLGNHRIYLRDLST
ncbi:MAG: formylmethanofuran--tetrahydromethanopterin N-formyltransferase [Candidatus Bathyarchaeia archaeon]